MTMDVLGQEFSVHINPAMVEAMELQKVIMAGFPTYPRELKISFNCAAFLEWYIGEIGEDEETVKWTQVAEGYFYTPSFDQVGHLVKLACTPMNAKGKEGFRMEAISENVVAPGPKFCPFETRQAFTAESSAPDAVRLVTYNLLAGTYVGHAVESFQPCPPYALDMNYRKLLILKELLGYNADVLCLQEVDQRMYKIDLHPVLTRKGYEGNFDIKDGNAREGVACFWAVDKFLLDHKKRYVLGHLVEEDVLFKDFSENLSNGSPAAKKTLCAQPTVLQVNVLRYKHNLSKGLIVGTTHLFSKVDGGHIRLLQAWMCLNLMVRTRSELDGDFAIVLSGDMNSTPPFGVYQFMLRGFIPEGHLEWTNCEREPVSGMALYHPLQMGSACGMPKYTTYTRCFVDCIDYIFYERDRFNVDQVVPFPSEEELSVAIPNPTFPSDHIACVADLKWKN